MFPISPPNWLQWLLNCIFRVRCICLKICFWASSFFSIFFGLQVENFQTFGLKTFGRVIDIESKHSLNKSFCFSHLFVTSSGSFGFDWQIFGRVIDIESKHSLNKSFCFSHLFVTSSGSFGFDWQIFGRVVDTAFYVSSGIFWEKLFFRSFPLIFFISFGFSEKFFRCLSLIFFVFLSIIFQQTFSQNSNWPVHKNILFRKNCFEKVILFFCDPRILSERIGILAKRTSADLSKPHSTCPTDKSEGKNSRILHCFYHFLTFYEQKLGH